MGALFRTGRSTNADASAAARDAVRSAVTGLGGVTPTCVILFASSRYPLGRVLSAAGDALPGSTQVMGCTTAGEITEAGITKGSVAAVAIADSGMDVTCTFADRISMGAERAAETLIAGMDTNPKKRPTLSMTLIDALTGAGEAVVDELRSHLGVGHQIVGGAAGDDGKLVRAQVGTASKVASDAVVTMHVHSQHPWAVGVDHGFSAATKMMRVTRAKGTIIRELDGQPVLDVYKAFARQQGQTWDNRTAASFLINNELGIYVFDEFRRARAPLAVNTDGSFACAAPIPEGSTVAILKSDEQGLLTAAKNAALEAKSRLKGRAAAGVFVFDCVCRGSILGDAFPRELSAIQQVFPGLPVAGFVTYGEIARYSGNFDGWHNASVVVVAVPS